jgi:hypothetical protein
VRGDWLRCCDDTYHGSDIKNHMQTHIARPFEDAMTLAEVAGALGHTIASVHHMARRGKLKTFMVDGKRPKWVMQQEFTRYVRAILKKDPGVAVRWAREEGLK